MFFYYKTGPEIVKKRLEIKKNTVFFTISGPVFRSKNILAIYLVIFILNF